MKISDLNKLNKEQLISLIRELECKIRLLERFKTPTNFHLNNQLKNLRGKMRELVEDKIK